MWKQTFEHRQHFHIRDRGTSGHLWI